MNESERIKNELKKLATYVRENPNNPEKLSFNWNASDKPWTTKIMTQLCKVGQDKCYQVCVTKSEVCVEKEPYRAEWLYDMTWLKFDNRELIDVPLVLECEWGYFAKHDENPYQDNRVQYDFQKLLLVRADLRCIIFPAKTLQDAKKYVEELIDVVERFQKCEIGDNYLFCIWLSTEKRFHFKDYTVS